MGYEKTGYGQGTYGDSAYGTGSYGSGGYGTNKFGGSEFTPAQEDLIPYIDQVKADEEAQKKKIRPIQKVFDILSRGQYLAANVAEEFLTALDDDDSFTTNLRQVAEAGLKGITGEVKGSWKDVLVNHTNLEEYNVSDFKFIPDVLKRGDKIDKDTGEVLMKKEDRFLGDVDLADIFGLVGDVVLDPLNLVSMGATSTARMAAKSFADDAVKLALKTAGADLALSKGDDLVKFATSAFDPKIFNRLQAEDMTKAVKYFNKKVSKNFSRNMNTTWKSSYQRALTESPETLRAEMTGKLDVWKTGEEEATQGVIDKMFKQNLAGKIDDVDYVKKTSKQTHKLEEKTSVIQELEEKYLTGYAGAGQNRLFNILGYDMGTTGAIGDFATSVTKGKHKILNYIGDTPVARGVTDAWASVMDNGAVGQIRKSMGVRTPYEKLIRQVELQEGSAFFQESVRTNIMAVDDVLGETSEEIQQKLVQLIDYAETASTKKNPMNFLQLMQDEKVIKKLGISDDEIRELWDLGTDVQGLTRQWRKEYNELAPYVKEMNFMENYLPVGYKRPRLGGVVKKGGTSNPSIGMQRGFSRKQVIGQESAKIKWLLKDTGVTKDQATKMVTDMNRGNIQMDLKTLLYSRAQAQASASKRANLMDSLKDFGINVKDVRGPTKTALNRSGATLEQLGLREIPEKGFKGMLFDETVADVFGNITKSVADASMPAVKAAFRNRMSWWKGIVTMTPGFHQRNALSNNVTGYMRHGMKWLNPAKDGQALAATIHGLAGPERNLILEAMNIPPSWVAKQLAKEVSPGRTLEMVADEARKSRLLSTAQMGFNSGDLATGVSKLQRANPGSTGFIGNKLSRDVGSIIENHSKMKSYLLSYDDVYKKLGDSPALAQEAHVFADLDSKKWFLDYEDLTEFEQNYMKDVIPFYSWIRKNFRNQVEGILMYPQMYSMFPKLKEFANLDDPEFDETLVPDWMANEGMFPVAKEEGKFKMYRPDMPFMDINLLPFTFEEGEFLPRLDLNELRDELVNSTSPVIKTVVSGLMENGYDFFKKTQLKETENAPYVMQLLVQKPETLNWLDNISKRIGLKGFPVELKDGHLKLPGKTVQLMNEFIPLFKQINYLIYTGSELIPGLEETIESVTGIEDDYERLEQTLQLLSYWTGVKNYATDQDELQERRNTGQYYEAMGNRTADLADDPTRQARNLRNDETRQDMIRRLVGGR